MHPFVGEFFIGYNAGESGTVIIHNGGHLRTSTAAGLLGWGNVGMRGHGTLQINSGGYLETVCGFVGRDLGGVGTAHVSGIWWNTRDLTVGWWGRGEMTIYSGGQVLGGSDFIQLARGGTASRGTIIVHGGGHLTTVGFITVGTEGTATLSVQGGRVEAGTTIQVNSGDTLTLNGGTVVASTLARSSGSIFSDNAGSVVRVNTLTGTGWGTHPTLASHLELGHTGGTGSHTVPSGGGLTVGGELDVGFLSTGTMTVDGNLTAAHLSMGAVAGVNGTVTIRNGGRANTSAGGWTQVGGSGQGALNVNAGGTLTNGLGSIAQNAGSVGTATVDGIWRNTHDLTVGHLGRGTLTVRNGGDVVSAGSHIGRYAGSVGTGTVTGVGSTWTEHGSMFLGGTNLAATASRGTLNITHGGQVTVADTLRLWHSSSANRGELNLTNGTVVAGMLDRASGSVFTDNTGSVVRVNALTGAGWGAHPAFAGSLQFGHSGGTGTHAVVSGGSLTSARLMDVGFNSLGTMTVDGNLTAEHLSMGAVAGGNGTVTIRSGGRTLANSATGGWTRVGWSGQGALNVNAGGTLTNAMGMIGSDVGSVGTATVDGRWMNTNNLTVGNLGAGALTVNSGGVVEGGRQFVSIGRESAGVGTATVEGRLTTTGPLNVGDHGRGLLTVRNGGDVVSTGSHIGRFAGSAGTGTVTGAGSTWTEHGSMFLGGHATATASRGTLNIEHGGQVTVADTLRLWHLDSVNRGTVNLSGGRLSAGTIDISTNAAFHFTGGELRVGTFVGNLLNQGGVLTPGASPGLTTVTGSYTQGVAGALNIELAGVGSHDALAVGGNAQLGGTLNVTNIGGFNPALHNAFTILTAQSVTGAFAHTNLPPVGEDFEWSVTHTPTSVVLRVENKATPYDLWAQARISDPGQRNPDRNPDNDASDNWQEYIADTDPMNAASVFRVTGIAHASSLTTMRFDSSAARVYTLQGRTNLTDGVWADVAGQGPRAGTGPDDSMTDTNHPSASSFFYRLKVELP